MEPVSSFRQVVQVALVLTGEGVWGSTSRVRESTGGGDYLDFWQLVWPLVDQGGLCLSCGGLGHDETRG